MAAFSRVAYVRGRRPDRYSRAKTDLKRPPLAARSGRAIERPSVCGLGMNGWAARRVLTGLNRILWLLALSVLLYVVQKGKEERSPRKRVTFPDSLPLGSRSRAGEEEPFLRSEVGRPLEAVRAGEVQIGAERVAHRVDEPVGRRGAKPSSHQRPSTSTRPAPGRSAVRSGRRTGRRRGSGARSSPSGASPAGRSPPTRSRSRTGSRAGRCPTAASRTGR